MVVIQIIIRGIYRNINVIQYQIEWNSMCIYDFAFLWLTFWLCETVSFFFCILNVSLVLLLCFLWLHSHTKFALLLTYWSGFWWYDLVSISAYLASNVKPCCSQFKWYARVLYIRIFLGTILQELDFALTLAASAFVHGFLYSVVASDTVYIAEIVL